MIELHILQLGDVHYPDWSNRVAADIKDLQISHRLVDRATRRPLRATLEVVQRLKRRHRPVVMICGDITSRGDEAGYRQAVTSLRDVLQLNDVDETPPADLHVTIGNHDVDRRVVSPDQVAEDGLKYGFARDAWRPLDLLPHAAPRVTVYRKGDAALHLMSINSCVGSGEFRGMPGSVRAEYERLTKEALGDESISIPALSNVYEQMDTPAFEATHLADLVTSIRELGEGELPIVLAHHGVLPQPETRIDAYTEVLNGGAARSQLSSCGRPVIYLHGHIHERRVDVVQQFHPRRGTLVCVSAPQLGDGFNFLTVQLNDNGRLLGLVVEQWERSSDGDIAKAGNAVRIPLVDGAGERNPLCAHVVTAARETMGARMRELSSLIEGPPGAADLIGDAVIEAEWEGHIMVDNRERECRHWIIRPVSS